MCAHAACSASLQTRLPGLQGGEQWTEPLPGTLQPTGHPECGTGQRGDGGGPDSTGPRSAGGYTCCNDYQDVKVRAEQTSLHSCVHSVFAPLQCPAGLTED